MLEETENPFLADFYAGRPGSALQAQLFYLLNRHRQQLSIRQGDLFTQSTVSDYLFDKDKIFAYLNLDDNELFIYQRLYDLLTKDVPAPDLVDLSSGADRRARSQAARSRGANRRRVARTEPRVPPRAERGLPALLLSLLRDAAARRRNLAAGPAGSDDALDDLIRQINAMGRGTQYYVPRT